MASFIGGEALARVVTWYVASASSGWQTIHTVPAGRYALVVSVESNGYTTIGKNSLTGSDIGVTSSSVITQANFQTQLPTGGYYDESEAIRVLPTVTAAVKIIILEYNKPDTLNLP